MPATYTVKEVADILGYSTNSIYTFLKEKRIKGVRVGKGRFRIPHHELDRLLEMAGMKKVLPAVERTTASLPPKDGDRPVYKQPVYEEEKQHEFHDVPHGEHEPVPEHMHLPAKQPDPNIPRIYAPQTEYHEHTDYVPVYRVRSGGIVRRIPDLFEWFTCIAAIILGVTMIFFRGTFEEFNVQTFSVWIPAMTSVCIGAGLGLLVTSLTNRVNRSWHSVFSFVLSLAFGFLAWIQWSTGDAEGSITYGIISLLIILKMFVRFDGLLSFALLGAGVVSGLPVAMILWPSEIVRTTFPWILTADRMTLTAFWTLGASTLFILVVFGYVRERIVFWATALFLSIALGGLSLFYGQALFWGRSFILLVLALMGLFVPVWDRFAKGSNEDKNVVCGAFGAVLMLFLVAIGVVRIVETGMVDFANGELTAKVAFAQTTVEGVLDTVHSSMENSASNFELVTAMEKGKNDDALKVIRTLFETRGLLRRIAVISSKGTMMALYPLEPSFATTTYALREFVTSPLNSHTYYISDYIVDGVDKGSVIVSMPVVSAEGDVLGVLVGWLDLSLLGTKLQQLAVAKNGEYVLMIDKTGRWMVNPDSAKISRQSEPNDVIRLALSRGKGVAQEYDTENQRMITSYGVISGRQWGIAIRMPLASVTRQTHVPLLLIGSISAITICLVLLLSMRHSYGVPREGGP
jgi:excisionase family DNA binding protein